MSLGKTDPPNRSLLFQDSQPSQGWEPLGENALDLRATNAELADEIPQTIEELGELLSTIYDLTATRAGELKIPVIGSIGGGMSRRIVVSEYSQTKLLVDSKGIELRYGYAIRFCLTINKWDANAKLSPPFLSAQAELGQIEAGWQMHVIGVNGPKIREAVLPPKPLSVETFVIAQQSLDALIKAVNDASTKFIPGIVVSSNDPNASTVRLRRGVVEAFALYRLFKTDTISQAIEGLGSTSGVDQDTIRDVYGRLGITSANEAPSANARTVAQTHLGGLKVTD